MKTHLSHAFKGYLFVGLALIFLTVIFTIAEALIKDIPPLTYAMYFFGLTSIISTPFHFIFYKPQTFIKTFRENQKAIGLVTVIFIFVACGFFYSISFMGATQISIYEKLSIVFSALLGIFVLKEKLTPLETFGIALSFIGATIISIEDFQLTNLIFTIIAVVYSFFLSLVSFAIKKYATQIPSALLNFYRMWGVSIALFILTAATGNLKLISFEESIFITLAGLCGVLGSSICFFEAHKHLPISTINSLAAVSPIPIAISTKSPPDSKPSAVLRSCSPPESSSTPANAPKTPRKKIQYFSNKI